MHARPQAIPGLNSGKDGLLCTVYPSIAGAGLGQTLGRLMNSIPVGIGNIHLSHLLFAGPVAALALPGYLAAKITGERYILTTHAIRRWSSLGAKMLQQVELQDIGDILVETRPGQEFFKAADLIILGKDGKRLMRLGGVPRAETFRETILKARAARVQVEESLTRIRNRPAVAAK